MTLEEKIRGLIQEFRQAYYGEDVRRTYADIAELVCIEAMKSWIIQLSRENMRKHRETMQKSRGAMRRPKETMQRQRLQKP